MKKIRFALAGLGIVLALTGSIPCHALEPQTLFNFQVSPGSVTGALIEGPDGNFYGTTTQGGLSGNGTVFRVTPGGALTTLVSDQANPAAGLVKGNDGLLYGMTGAGGAFGFGTVFKMTTAGALTNFAVLDGVNGGNPQSGLVLAADGNFYGTSQEGGTNGAGAVFRVTPGGVVTRLASFDAASAGGFPIAGLANGPDGNLYGVTSIGGDAGRGTIFKITTDGKLTTLHSFQGTDGFVNRARLTLGPDGNLYGTSRDGGSADLGEIYKITTNGVFTTVASFNGTNGSVPFAELTVGADSQLYGTTELGGSAGVGTIFKVSTNGVLTSLVSFSNPINGQPLAGLLLASDGNFYGCSQGAVFKMTPGGVLFTVVSLVPLAGIHPEAGLTFGTDGDLYGTTQQGGSNNLGTIFKITPDGVLTSLHSFSGADGSTPQGGLTLGKDGNFYGTTITGGAGSAGTVFRFSADGTLTTLASFKNTNGASPQCQLVLDADGNIYGTAPHGGPQFDGVIFRIATNGVLTTLAVFNGTNGAFSSDGLTPGSDGNFYGTATSGAGSGSFGSVYRVTPGGSLTTLISFNNTNGANPFGGVVQGGDGVLYGATGFGGTNLSFGTIFKVTTNGALTTLFNFHFTDGEQPTARMIFGADGNLYGTTVFGGSLGNDPFSNGEGTVFRISTNGNFTPLVFFQGTNGANPQGPVTLGPDGNLYGTTANGGPGGGGTVFRIVLAPKLTNIAHLPGGSIAIAGTGPADGAYRLWAASAVSTSAASWTVLTNGVFAVDGTFSFTDTGTAAAPARFYRVSVP